MWRGVWWIAALGALWACGDMAAPQQQTQAPEAPLALTEKVPLPPARQAEARGPGFASRRSFEQHFEKHGAEFGHIDQAEYLALAQRLRDKPVGGPVLEIVRQADGVVTRFDRETGYFGAYNRDGTIRTFFIPNDGERYFQRQARGAH
jgi:pyocin large subunit-like protein